MPSARRISVRFQLMLAILIAIILSWIISGGLSNYIAYLNVKSMRTEMLKRPDLYPMPIPEPKFGISDFLLGPRRPMGPPRNDATRPPGPPNLPQRPSDVRPQGPPPPAFPDMPPRAAGPRGRDFPAPPRPEDFVARNQVPTRIFVALVLALIMGAWLGRRFTRPLTELADGANAFHSGDFKYRIPTDGENEFTRVADTMNEMAECVSEQIGRLEEDAKRRRQFMADIAHELKSPVTTMKTMADAMADGLAEDPERKERAVTALCRTSERMLRLVTDMMELAKLDLNELPLNVVPVDIREVVGSAVQSHEAKAQNLGVTLHTLELGRPIMAMVDPDRLIQIVDNVVENAICHAGEGAEVRVDVNEGDPVRITVSDNGIGIPAKDMPYIFDSFYRVDAARTPGGTHSGLGLRIARGLVEAHGGKMSLSSVEGKGTTVEILLPS